jgi:hypothetical protein
MAYHLSVGDEEHLYFIRLFSYLISDRNKGMGHNLDTLESPCFFFQLILPEFDKNGQIL